MGNKVDQKTKELEAFELQALISDRWKGSAASFAKAAGRTRAELDQHLTCARPIPLSAAKSYAKVLDCRIEDFCQRWADEFAAQPSRIEAKTGGEIELNEQQRTVIKAWSLIDPDTIDSWVSLAQKKLEHNAAKNRDAA